MYCNLLCLRLFLQILSKKAINPAIYITVLFHEFEWYANFKINWCLYLFAFRYKQVIFVGGKLTTFQTRAKNMVKFSDSKLAKMSKPGKVFFLDHNPKYFEVILDHLRYGKVMNFCDEKLFNGVYTLAKDLELMGVLLLKVNLSLRWNLCTHSNSEDSKSMKVGVFGPKNVCRFKIDTHRNTNLRRRLKINEIVRSPQNGRK